MHRSMNVKFITSNTSYSDFPNALYYLVYVYATSFGLFLDLPEYQQYK
jgi:hypothetical protein